MRNKRALLKAGWTAALIDQVLGVPDEVRTHRRGYMAWKECLYLDSRVRLAEADERFVAAERRRAERAAAAAHRREDLARQYASWRDALPEAAAALFSLNRYAKHRACGAPSRVEIYALKNDFVRMPAVWQGGGNAAAGAVEAGGYLSTREPGVRGDHSGAAGGVWGRRVADGGVGANSAGARPVPLMMECPCGHSAPVPETSGRFVCSRCGTALSLAWFRGRNAIEEWRKWVAGLAADVVRPRIRFVEAGAAEESAEGTGGTKK